MQITAQSNMTRILQKLWCKYDDSDAENYRADWKTGLVGVLTYFASMGRILRPVSPLGHSVRWLNPSTKRTVLLPGFEPGPKPSQKFAGKYITHKAIGGDYFI